jgi:hypothetical protein
MNATYIYYYKADSSKEPVGRVFADDVEDAVEQIAVIKHLSRDSIESLFVIECLKGGKDENDI